MVFLLFVISIFVLEAILQADKKRQKQELSHAPSEPRPEDRKSQSEDLIALLEALQNHAEPPSNQPVAGDKGYNRERGRTE
jgi:hypothetical protein